MRTTRLYINTDGWHEVDLYDDASIPVSYSIQDIKDISKKTSTHSATFSIPNTPHNGRLFNCNHEVNIYQSTFEMLRSYPARLEQNGREVMAGTFELNRVIKNGGVYSYEGIMYSTVKNIAEVLGQSTLRGNYDSAQDLDFSDQNLTEQETSIIAIGNRLVAGRPLFSGVGFTLIDKSDKQDLNFYCEEVTPVLYVKDILDRIMAKAGVTYQSSFISGKRIFGGIDFSTLVYPWVDDNGKLIAGNPVSSEIVEKLPEDPREEYVFEPWDIVSYDNSSRGTSITFNNQPFTFPFPSGYRLTETGVSSTLSAYKFTAPQTGSYHVNVNIPFRLRCNFVTKNTAYVDPQWHVMNYGDAEGYELAPYITAEDDIEVDVFYYHGSTQLWRRTQQIYGGYNDRYEFEDKNGRAAVTFLEDAVVFEDDVQMSSGEDFEIRIVVSMRCTPDGTHSTTSRLFLYPIEPSPIWDWEYAINALPDNVAIEALQGAGIDIAINNRWSEGVALNATNILSDSMTQWDFINGIFRMFNLYCEDLGGDVLRIEPYELFYADRPVHDWTQKIDRASMEFTRIGDYVRRIVDFLPDADSDTSTSGYKADNGIEYGEVAIMGPLANSHSEKAEIKTTFALSMDKEIDSVDSSSNNIAARLPMIFERKDADTINTDAAFSPRIMVMSRTRAKAVLKSHGTILPTLPVWGYMMTTSEPLKFDNIYPRFYKDTLTAINSRESRLLKCSAYLTAADISELRMSDTIVVDGQAYHINSINEWTGSDAPCEVELIRIII